MILFSIITYGIYIPFWLLSHKDIFNKLKSSEKLNSGSILFILGLFVTSALLLIPLHIFKGKEIALTITIIDSFVSLMGGVGVLMLSFQIRRMLKEHYKTKLSWVWTLCFSVFYLQYKINRL